MRFRGKCNVEFIDNNKITVERVVNVTDVDTANKICAIEFHGNYKHNDRVKQYNIVPCTEDTMVKPSPDFIRERLLKYANKNLSTNEREKAKDEIYTAFRTYQPSWDDDTLSDILSWYEVGEIKDLKSDIKYLLDEIDGLWCCHYRAHLNNLDEQYTEAIS